MTDKLDRAAKLRDEANRLVKEAFAERPLPDYWRVGQKVRFIRDMEFAWSKGDIGRVCGVRNPGTPAADYQVLSTESFNPDDGGRFWTTPDDVELVEDVIPDWYECGVEPRDVAHHTQERA